jgi:hypothetical protein
MPEADNICIQYTQSEEYNLDNTFQGQIPSFLVLYFSWTPPNQILQFHEHLPLSKAISTFSKRCKMTQNWVLHSQSQEYAMVIPKKCKGLHGWVGWVDGFIQVVKQMNTIYIVPIGEIIGQAHLVEENAILCSIDGAWLENNHLDSDTDWMVY